MLVYPELRRRAIRYLRQERPGHTLRPTGLVHEVYMRLFGPEPASWQNRAHFFSAVAREMRHLLVDYARARNAKKRSEGNVRISLSDVYAAADARDEDLVALDEALSRLEQIDARASRVVELRFFTGLSERETAAGSRDLDLDAEARLELRESVALRSALLSCRGIVSVSVGAGSVQLLATTRRIDTGKRQEIDHPEGSRARLGNVGLQRGFATSRSLGRASATR